MFIWRRKGWVSFAMLIFGGACLEFFIEDVLGFGEFYYQESPWPFPLCLCLTAIVCWKFGTRWNDMIPIDPETGQLLEKTHTAFFIRMEYWGYALHVIAIGDFLRRLNMTQ